MYYNFSRSDNSRGSHGGLDSAEELHIGMDFNVNPMSACVAVIENDVIDIVDEISLYGSNTNEMVDEIRARYGPRRCVIYPDPTCSANKTSAGGKTDLSILQGAGFPVRLRREGVKVRDRINAVNAKLKNAAGVISMFVDPKCKHLIQCLERQIYKEGTSQPDKSEGFDHMNDALGYFVDYLYPIESRKIKHTRLVGA